MRKPIAILMLLAAGCGGAPEAPVVVAETTVLTGVASKGPLQGAAVDFFEVNADGSAGAAFTSTTPFPVETDAAGGFAVAGLPNDRPMLVRASGGSFVDESDPTPGPGRRVISFAPGEFLEAVVPAGASSIAITPYSMAVLEKSRAQAGTSNFVAVYAAVHALAQQAFGFDPVLIAPADPVNPSPTAPLAAKQYALLLGAAAQVINGIAVANGGAPTHAEVMAFVADFADGRLDVTSLADEIARFRNNNYDRYADTPLPAVNEDLLATDPEIPDQPPTIGAIADEVIAEDSATAPLAFTVDDAETPAADLVVTTSSGNTVLVPNANVVPGGSGASRTVTVTPAANRSGAANITVTVTDGAGNTASETFQLTVTAVNDIPVANDDAISLAEGGSATTLVGGATSVAANDSDVDNDPLSVTLVSGPANAAVFLLNADGSSYKVNDGSADSNVATVSIAIAAVNDAPTLDAIADPSAILEDAGLQTLSLAGIGAGPGEAQNLTVAATSNNVALIPNPAVSYTSPAATGSLSYTPVANQSGSATITVTVMDDGGTAGGGVNTITRTFTVAVTPVNDAPVAVDDTASTETNTAVGIAAASLAANDTDVEGSGLTVTAVANPVNGSVNLASGTVTFTPANGFSGNASFEYTVSDGSASDTGLVTVSVSFVSTPWLTSLHSGELSVATNTTKAVLDWPTTGGHSYNLYVATDPDTDLGNYATYGATYTLNVTPPYTVSGLTPGQPVFFALEDDDGGGPVLISWTAATPNVQGVDRNGVKGQAIAGDGTRYVGGEFGRVGPLAGAGITLNPSGSAAHPLAFPMVRGGQVRAAAADGNGGWYLGGTFTTVGGLARLRLAHVDRQGRVTNWNPGANNTVNALAVDAGAGVIYAGGSFSAVGGGTGTQSSRTRLAAFDVSGNVTGWNAVASGDVNALALGSGVIYAGGDFFNANGGVARRRLAAYTTAGSLTSWNPGADNTVFELAVASGIVYAGGWFTAAGGGTGTTPRNYLAAFDATGALTSWNPGANGSVGAMAIDAGAGVIYVGGGFTGVGGGTGSTSRKFIAALDASGTVLPWNPGTSSDVAALAVDAGVIYAGGAFEYAGGGNGLLAQRNYLAAFDTSGNLTSWNPGLDRNGVLALAFSNGVLYAGGSFEFTGTVRYNTAAFDPDGNLLPWAPQVDSGYVNAIAELAGTIYVGGTFIPTTACPRYGLAAFDTAGGITSFAPLAGGGAVNVLTASGGVLYAGGNFPQPRTNLAAFDAAGNLTSWTGGANGGVYALAADAGVIYVGGLFSAAGGSTGTTPRNRLAAFDLAGNLTAWDPGASGLVLGLAVDGGVVYAGGTFTAAGGGTGTQATRNRLAAFDASGNLAGWNPGANSTTVYALAASAGTIYAGGTFTAVGGGTGTTSRSHVAAFDAAGNVTSWNPGVNGSVESLLVNGGVVHAGGLLGGAGTPEQLRKGMAAFDTSGNLLVK